MVTKTSLIYSLRTETQTENKMHVSVTIVTRLWGRGQFIVYEISEALEMITLSLSSFPGKFHVLIYKDDYYNSGPN